MTMKVTGRKASLYATAMAISLVALSGTAHAQSATGSLKALATSKESKGAAKADTRTEAEKAAAAALLARKTSVVNSVGVVIPTTSAEATAINTLTVGKAVYELTVAKKAETTATTDLATKQAALVKAEAAKVAADANAAALLAAKTSADTKAAQASAAHQAAVDAQGLAVTANNTAPTAATAAAVTAANAAVATALVAKNAAAAEATAAGTAYTGVASVAGRAAVLAVAAVTGVGVPGDANYVAPVAAVTGVTAITAVTATGATAAAEALAAYTSAITARGNADSTALNSQATRISKEGQLAATVAADTALAAKLASVNAVEGTAFTGTYEGLLALNAYDDDTYTAGNLTSNGIARAQASVAAATASANANIQMASAALTGATAATDIGAIFETEVLSVLVNHETRITTNEAGIAANKTAIAALDVRTTSNTTAIAALDVRTTANTTAIANEVTARIAADNALGARITAETDARIAADNVLRDQIASSTATAIAMGGAALLPDMGFTLSGNIAVYEGAQAMALNAAAKVGANAYVTAAVGGGLNKNGSVGGRVGFVFGF